MWVQVPLPLFFLVFMLLMNQLYLNKKRTLVQLRAASPLAFLPKVISISVIVPKAAGSLHDSFIFKQQLARFGFLAATPTFDGRKVVSFSRFFNLSDLGKEGLELSQFFRFFCFLCAHRSTIVRPLGICIGNRAFSIQDGVRWVNNIRLSCVHPRGYLLLNFVRILLLLLQVILSRPIFVLNLGLCYSRRLSRNLWYPLYADNVTLDPLIFDDAVYLQKAQSLPAN